MPGVRIGQRVRAHKTKLAPMISAIEIKTLVSHLEGENHPLQYYFLYFNKFKNDSNFW